jgi:hypothetical protein
MGPLEGPIPTSVTKKSGWRAPLTASATPAHWTQACAATGRIAAHGGWRAKPVTSIDRIHLLQRQAGRCAASKTVFDPDLEQGCAATPPSGIRSMFSSIAGAAPDCKQQPRTLNRRREIPLGYVK